MRLGADGYDIVVPSLGRPSVDLLLSSLTTACASPGRVVVVDDRRRAGVTPVCDPRWMDGAELPVVVARSGGRGPAAARNAGLRTLDRMEPAQGSAWVVFLDDDVVVGPDWGVRLAADLRSAPACAAAVSGRIRVPLPAHRRPTDWERNTARLETARGITADLAIRRAALAEVGGFDESFPRAFREDSDLVLRLERAGWTLAAGSRETTHPVRPAGFLASVRAQAGNADHARMVRRHGRGYRRLLHEPKDTWVLQAAATTALAVAAAGALARRWRVALVTFGAWVVATGWFAVLRLLPGPRDRTEVARMVVTSALIPPVAVAHRLKGYLEAGAA